MKRFIIFNGKHWMAWVLFFVGHVPHNDASFNCLPFPSKLPSISKQSGNDSKDSPLEIMNMINALRNEEDLDDEDFEDADYEYDDLEGYESRLSPMQERKRITKRDATRGGWSSGSESARRISTVRGDGSRDSSPSSFGRGPDWSPPEGVSNILLTLVFFLGIALGISVNSAVKLNTQGDLTSRIAVDSAAPNSKLCAQYGASAMSLDQRVFVSFNPFNVYISQSHVEPACVLNQANVAAILKDQSLISEAEFRGCRQNFNTWAFVGDLTNKDSRRLSCVYKSDTTQNGYLRTTPGNLGVSEGNVSE